MATPVTTPPATVAIVGAVVDQVPPPTPSVNVTVLPTQISEEEGESAPGVTSIVTTLVAEQPELLVYEIVTDPAATPVTTPPPVTVAVPGAPLLQVPPGVISARVVVAPTHTETGPAGVIVAGLAFTVTYVVTKQVPTV